MTSNVDSSKNILIALAIFGSYISYLNFKFPYLGYIFALVSLTLYCLLYTKYRPRSSVLYMVLAYTFVILISLLGSDDFTVEGLIQQLLYPFSLLLLLVLSCNLPNSLKKVADFLVAIVLLNFFIAIVNSIFGPFGLPLLGDLRHGRDIFFLSLPSSAGLFWGVNYFAISNLVLSLFITYLYSLSNVKLNKFRRLFLILCYSSVIWGSSRSITAILLLCVLLIFLFSKFNHRKVMVFGFFSMLVASFTAASLYNYLSNDSYYNETFRIYKGLNNRDDIWEAGLVSLYENPILGNGSIASFEADLLSNGSPTTAVQNMYLLSLLKNGIAGYLILMAFLFYSTYLFLRSNNPNTDKYLFLIVLTITLDGFFRSYSLGGLGTASFIFSLSISLLLNRVKGGGIESK